MPRTNNQKGKLLALLQLFTEETDEQHPLSVPALLERLEAVGIRAERKSIYEDIHTLQRFGYDIILQRGRGYYLGERDFQLAELKLLVDAVQASKFITPQKSQALIDKLARQTSRYQASALQRQVYVAGKAKSANERVYYTIDAIYEAIGRNKQVSFRYFDLNQRREKVYRKGGAEYVVSPYTLVRDNDNYYLVAYDKTSGRLRHYRVDKMDRIAVRKEARLGREIYQAEDPARYADLHFGMFQGEEKEVVLRCQDWTAHVLIDRFGDNLEMYPDEGNTFRAVVRVVVSPQFFGWLFGLNGGAVVLAPEPVRFQMEQMLTAQLEQYKKEHS
ncbi:MAG: WYL domain-containing transcriptional regulator [Clostridiales bacterium]|nr:WYL domain-containing transcriptional regulator [Clostridiales bacterium]